MKQSYHSISNLGQEDNIARKNNTLFPQGEVHKICLLKQELKFWLNIRMGLLIFSGCMNISQ